MPDRALESVPPAMHRDRVAFRRQSVRARFIAVGQPRILVGSWQAAAANRRVRAGSRRQAAEPPPGGERRGTEIAIPHRGLVDFSGACGDLSGGASDPNVRCPHRRLEGRHNRGQADRPPGGLRCRSRRQHSPARLPLTRQQARGQRRLNKRFVVSWPILPTRFRSMKITAAGQPCYLVATFLPSWVVRCANTSSASFFCSAGMASYNEVKTAESFLMLSAWTWTISP